MIRIFVMLVVLSVGPASAQSFDLKNCMDIQYGAGQWTGWTAPGIGTDIGPALTRCLTTIKSTWGRGEIVVPPGNWLMRVPPSCNLLSGSTIRGYGSTGSAIIFSNSGIPGSVVALHWCGSQGYTGGGVRGASLILDRNLGETLAYGIMLRGDSMFQPDQMVFEDVIISAMPGSWWWEALHIEGDARASPLGVRIASLNMVQLFASRNVAAYVSRAIGFTFTTVGCYAGRGLAGNWFWDAGTNINASYRAIVCDNKQVP